ncbi:hypothetical protein BDV30DRAFT_234179 [Aspergillus minisclerotigenes]|uniref:CSD domain-containing protein n=1 Tax=Aspergillus minisclerotigenes TaxID=656917 RepID=A0A5N6JH79_9EURO|nr:hypothetical protein BDV30DRAFT_234179 [Aspergillus minisclerotigenes]
MPQGVVKFFDVRQGFGIIGSEGSQGPAEDDIPFTPNVILADEDEEPPFPQPGSKVEYEVKEDAGAKHAVKIRFITSDE